MPHALIRTKKLYTIDYYDAVIALLYPLGLLVAIIGGIEGGFGAFLATVIITYFSPQIFFF